MWVNLLRPSQKIFISPVFLIIRNLETICKFY